MSVEELMEALAGLDPKAKVVLCCDYGDRHSTMQAVNLTHVNECEPSDFEETGYSHTGVALSHEAAEEMSGSSVACLCVVS